MPSIYMLNLVFDATNATAVADSRFQEYDRTKPLLQQSKAWLVATNANPGQDDPNSWAFHQVDTGTPLSTVPGDQTWVRVLGLNINVSSWTARMTTIVARATSRVVRNPNGQPYQQHASPFQLAQGQSCVIFDFVNPVFQACSSGGSWLQQLGASTITTPPPKPPNYHDAYSVIVAVTAVPGDGTPTQVYSHDPDMDVQC